VTPARARAILPAPQGWSPQAALAAYYPAIAALCRGALPEIRAIEREADRDEALGRNRVYLRQAIGEALWRLQYTGDADAAAGAVARVRAISLSPSALLATRDEEGSCGVGTGVWFLKLDASVDAMLAADFDAGDNPSRFLDRVNDPDRLRDYLTDLRLSHLAKDGVDRRKELNFASADLVRLILRRRPQGYSWDPRLYSVVRNFVAEWQDPRTGFFGADYEIDGEVWRTVDLSMTFHMARYLDGRIGYWQRLIDTLMAIRDDRYPNGWLDAEGTTSHNNYDVAMLFSLGWPQMRTDQRRRAAHELNRLLRWCLETAIAPDGAVVGRAIGEALPESYYFTIAFLETVGFFNPAKRFWTAAGFPTAPALRASLEQRVRELHPQHPMVPMALARLRS
jgi:hypothetical protein